MAPGVLPIVCVLAGGPLDSSALVRFLMCRFTAVRIDTYVFSSVGPDLCASDPVWHGNNLGVSVHGSAWRRGGGLTRLRAERGTKWPKTKKKNECAE